MTSVAVPMKDIFNFCFNYIQLMFLDSLYSYIWLSKLQQSWTVFFCDILYKAGCEISLRNPNATCAYTKQVFNIVTVVESSGQLQWTYKTLPSVLDVRFIGCVWSRRGLWNYNMRYQRKVPVLIIRKYYTLGFSTFLLW